MPSGKGGYPTNAMARLEKQLTGFTFIELLVVMGLMAILALFISGSLSNLINISQQTSRQQLVKNEGDHIIEVINRMAQSSRPLDCLDNSYLTILNPDGGTTRFLIDGTNIASRSADFGENIETSTKQIPLNDSQVKVSNFKLDCSHFSRYTWGSWVTLKFTLTDTLSSHSPVSYSFESVINFPNH